VLNGLIKAFRDYEQKNEAPGADNDPGTFYREEPSGDQKLKSGGYRLYSRKINAKTGKRRNLGTFPSRAAAEKHERAVQYFKRAGG